MLPTHSSAGFIGRVGLESWIQTQGSFKDVHNNFSGRHLGPSKKSVPSEWIL